MDNELKKIISTSISKYPDLILKSRRLLDNFKDVDTLSEKLEKMFSKEINNYKINIEPKIEATTVLDSELFKYHSKISKLIDEYEEEYEDDNKHLHYLYELSGILTILEQLFKAVSDNDGIENLITILETFEFNAIKDCLQNIELKFDAFFEEIDSIIKNDTDEVKQSINELDSEIHRIEYFTGKTFEEMINEYRGLEKEYHMDLDEIGNIGEEDIVEVLKLKLIEWYYCLKVLTIQYEVEVQNLQKIYDFKNQFS